MSLDEAFLDLTAYLAHPPAYGVGALPSCEGAARGVPPLPAAGERAAPVELCEAERVVAGIRRRILETTKLTASAGIAPNFMLAKICSGVHLCVCVSLFVFS